MTQQRLHVFLGPSLREMAWRQALTQAALNKGLTVGVLGGPPADVVIAEHIADKLWPAIAPKAWVVLADTPSSALTAHGRRLEEAPPGAKSWTTASARLAAASWLVEQGAPLLGMPALSLGLPRLGLVSAGSPGLPPEEPGLAEALLSLYDQLPVPVGAKAHWPRDLLSYPLGSEFTGGHPDVDLTGRARLFVYGPYVALPPGRWRATMKLRIDPEGGHVPLLFDWGPVDDMVQMIETVREPGFYTVALEHAWSRPGPVQVRLGITEPLFQGRIEILECTVERLADLEATEETAATVPAQRSEPA